MHVRYMVGPKSSTKVGAVREGCLILDFNLFWLGVGKLVIPDNSFYMDWSRTFSNALMWKSSVPLEAQAN